MAIEARKPGLLNPPAWAIDGKRRQQLQSRRSQTPATTKSVV
jgi:hypothetical protein